MNETQLSAEERLRREVSGLAVDDILALCYAFSHRTERLRLYLDVLRKRGGDRAQFACCVICFDLARKGDEASQKEFVFLADTIRGLAGNEALVQALVGNDPYLSFVWELLVAQLAEMDARFEAEHTAMLPPRGAEDVASLDLLSDEDFADFGIAVDDAALQERFAGAVEQFLGGVPGVPAYDPESGFRLRHRHDSDRVEHFLMELDSLREPVVLARGFRALTLLFYGSHLRSKSLFGALNERKQSLLREGLQEFLASGEYMGQIAGVLGPMHAGRDVWAKIAEILLDYVHWLSRVPSAQRPAIGSYTAVERQVARDSGRGKRRRRGKR